MIDDIVRDLQVLAKANCMIGKIWLNVMARRFGLYAFAGLLAALELAMANVAVFNAFQQSWGPVWAAGTVAAADLVIASIVALLAGNIRPGPEIELAFDVRKMALEAVRANSRDVKAGVEFGRPAAQTNQKHHCRLCRTSAGHRSGAPAHSGGAVPFAGTSGQEGAKLNTTALDLRLINQLTERASGC